MTLHAEIVAPLYIEQHSVHRQISFQDGDLTIKCLESDEDIIQAYRLRNQVFCEELGWSLPTQNALEVDEHDKHAIFLGALNKQGRLLAFLRFIPSDKTFMIENEFLSLIGRDHLIRKESDTVEISRLCVAPESRKDKVAGNFGVHYISMLLFKGVYQWCAKNHVRHLYAITEHKIFKLFCLKGFPCKLIGEPYMMPDGVFAVAFMIDLREWETLNMLKTPKILDWFNAA